MAKFIDYNKNPGYWFMIMMSIGEEVSKNPANSARIKTYKLNEVDILEAFDYGLSVYKHLDRAVKMRY